MCEPTGCLLRLITRQRYLLLLALLGLASRTQADDADPLRVVLRKPGDDGAKSYRIPGLATSVKGTLLAVFDIRHDGNGDLPANIDVGLMRSADQGETWGPMQRILDFDSAVPNSHGNGVGDPAILVDRQDGTIWVAALWSKGDHGYNGSKPGLSPDETGQLVLTKSEDDGITWSAPINITSNIKGRDPAWRLFFNGPGNGIQQRNGTLVFAAQYREADGTPRSCLLYSKDHGMTWTVTPPAIADMPPTNEAQVAELDDGSLLLSMRNYARSGQRVWARWIWRADGNSGEWSPHWSVNPDPTCMASLIRHTSGDLFFSNPAHASKRRDMTVRRSADGGRTWIAGRLIDAGPSAYSCLTELADGRIGLLYEAGKTLTFVRFSANWVENKDRTPH